MRHKAFYVFAAAAILATSLGIVAAFAQASPPASAKPPAAQAAKPPASVPVDFTANDVFLAGTALSHAGAACDAGVAVYCQILQVREPTAAKLEAAAKALGIGQAPAPAKP